MSMRAELHEVRVFLALADELHFGRAAQRLVLTPSRVSQVISKLERSLGGRLFERTSRSVRLTPFGERFLASVRPAYQELEAALSGARELVADTAESLRVGFTSTVDGPALSRHTAAFQARHPRCRMSMHEVPVCDPYAPLRRNEVDVVANWLAVREIVQLTMADLTLLRREDLLLVPVRDLEPMPLGLIWAPDHASAAVGALAEVARSLSPFRATLSQGQPVSLC